MTPPEVTEPEVTYVTEVYACATVSRAFFLTIVVVQNVSLRMTDVATDGQVTPNGFPWKGARTRHRKLHNIRLSGASSPKMT